MSAAEDLKQLKIQTGVVKRCMKDLAYSTKEIAKQQERIQKTMDDPEKDEADVRKQKEVLQEYLDTPPREQSALLEGYQKLLATVQEAAEESENPLLKTDQWTDAIAALTA